MNIRRFRAAGLLLLPLAFVSAACVGVTKPQGWASPAIDGSTAYILEEKDTLSALTLSGNNSAQVTWSFPNDRFSDQKDIDLEAVYAQPVLEGDTIYMAAYSGDVVAINRQDGALVRRREFSGNIAGGLALEGGQLAFATTDGDLFLLNTSDFGPANGWDRSGVSFGRGIWTTPVLTRDRVYVSTMGGEIVALNRSDGSVAWRVKHDGAIPTLAMLDEQHLFAGSLSKDVYVVDAATGDEVSHFQADDWVWNVPAFKDGTAYFADFSGKVYALDITSGEPKWTYDAAAKVKSGPVIVDDVLVIADRKPVVHFVKLADGTELNRVPILDAGTVRADLVLHERRALVLTTDGKLFAADPSTSPASVVPISVGGGQ